SGSSSAEVPVAEGREVIRVAVALLWAKALHAQTCAGCHAEIYRKYMQTGMARSSGRVGTGNFTEKLPAAAGRFRVTHEKESFRMHFNSGSRDLKWFIGSGAVGRSYGFEADGFLFQAPVSYYSAVQRWDLSPGYTGKSLELAKPIEEPCLTCH